MKFFTHHKRGFTLIEMLVSVALFATVMVMALGALLSLSVADRRAEAMKSAMDNLTFALDSMTRTIRTGSTYYCGVGAPTVQQDCASGGTQLSFVNSNGAAVYYRLDATNVSCGSGYTSCIERSTDGTTWYPITAPDIAIQNTSGYLFYVVGSSPTVQPQVTITINGAVNISSSLSQVFHMQTLVTQRIYDL